ncbi:DUF3106 domain-containing protein [Cerasicoccus frondis]|uniref:DUF3106 domain-containing protein n=1 Tax=Cerasicoccus frondis TaxID=490090 RepID=UPI0028524E1B|nr:DUF3106 domain-containing protein [Cerasicoccus frondis]
MTPRHSISRFLLGLTSSALLIGMLQAENQRYPGLHAPFGSPPHQMEQGGDSLPPPPPGMRPESAQDRQQAKKLLDEINDSSANAASADERISIEQLYALQRFLEMPPEQLAKIRQTIERVETMSDEEKAAIRAKIEAFRNLQEDKIQKFRDTHRMWSDLKPEDRRLLHRYVMSLPREEAEAIRESISQMSPEQQQAAFQALLEDARVAEAEGTLPSMADNIRKWRKDRREGDDNRWRKREREPQQEEPLPGPPPELP